MTECTFLDPGHRERARRFGHLHIDDLVERRSEFSNRYLVLAHLSARHRPAELRAAVRERLEPLAPEVLIVGEDEPEAPSVAC
jgi:ribonuclease Z